ncbi:MAG: indole-3-glycerol phosphate synthase TrpC [Fibrobacteres bacterium]|nr:indole-3-glycerol phosphate synthase TrpC [Fibrobacterota bacterium]
MTILEQIIKRNRPDLDYAMKNFPIEEWPDKLHSMKLPPVKSFTMALKRPDRLAVIAEIKKASPSKGVIRENFDPVAIARDYVAHDADALSVLTEPYFFQGAKSFLSDVRRSVNVPVLRKDFLVEPWQVYEARVMGADVVLLIMSVLDNKQVSSMLKVVKELDMFALVEVHDEEETHRAVDCGAEIIGINNRNLHTFNVDIKTTERIMYEIPRECLKVSESGISTPDVMDYLDKLGVNGVLIGEAFMRAASPGRALAELLSKHGRNKTK